MHPLLGVVRSAAPFCDSAVATWVTNGSVTRKSVERATFFITDSFTWDIF